MGSGVGFIFATFDAEAPPLHEYLGEVAREGLNLLAARGDLQIVGGVGKYSIPCNWKLAADNSWDFYHPYFSHASAFMSGVGQAQPAATGKEQPPPPPPTCAELPGLKLPAVLVDKKGSSEYEPQIVSAEEVPADSVLATHRGLVHEFVKVLNLEVRIVCDLLTDHASERVVFGI